MRSLTLLAFNRRDHCFGERTPLREHPRENSLDGTVRTTPPNTSVHHECISVAGVAYTQYLCLRQTEPPDECYTVTVNHGPNTCQPPPPLFRRSRHIYCSKIKAAGKPCRQLRVSCRSGLMHFLTLQMKLTFLPPCLIQDKRNQRPCREGNKVAHCFLSSQSTNS